MTDSPDVRRCTVVFCLWAGDVSSHCVTKLLIQHISHSRIMLTHQQLLGNNRSGLVATLFWQSCVSWWPNFTTCRKVSRVQRSSMEPLCVAATFQQMCHCTTSVPRSSRLLSTFAIVTLQVCLCKEQRA